MRDVECKLIRLLESKNWGFLFWWRIQGRIVDWLAKLNGEILTLKGWKIVKEWNSHLWSWNDTWWFSGTLYNASDFKRTRERFIVGEIWLWILRNISVYSSWVEFEFAQKNVEPRTNGLECTRVHQWFLQNFHFGWTRGEWEPTSFKVCEWFNVFQFNNLNFLIGIRVEMVLN